MAAFTAIFTLVLTLNVVLTIRSSSHWNKLLSFYRGTQSPLENDESAKDESTSLVHSLLLRKYLCVYLLAALSDWLQGPYGKSYSPSPLLSCFQTQIVHFIVVSS